MQQVAVVEQQAQASALVHPERRRLLAALVEPESAAGLGRILNLPRQRLNYHLNALERVGLISMVKLQRKGNCTERVLQASARSYVLSPEVLGALGTTPQETADRFSAAYLLSLASRIVRELAALMSRAEHERKRVATLAIETEIVFATPDDRAQFADELTEAVATLAAKFHQERALHGRRFRLVAAAYPAPTKET